MYPQPDSENIKAQRYAHLSHSPAICPGDIWLPQQNVGLLPRKISVFFWPVKDNLGLRTPGVNSIPCKCDQVYIGKTGLSIETRIMEHHQYHSLDIQRNRWWQNLGSTLITSLTSKMPESSLPILAMWTDLSGRQLSLSPTQTMWTGRIAWLFSRPRKLIHLLRGSRQPASSGDLLTVLLRNTFSFSSPTLYWCFHSPVMLLVRALADLTYCPVPLGRGELSSLLFHCLLFFSFSSLFLYFVFMLYFIYLFISFSFLSFFPVISYIYI
jgi:hypothetical protein